MNTRIQCQQKEYWDARAENYDALFELAPIRREAFDYLKSHIPKNVSDIVDLGAGTGQLTQYLLPYYPHANFSLVDISSGMLNMAKQNLMSYENVAYYETSFKEIPLCDNSIDLVVSSFALHHVPDLEKTQVAKELRRILREGGMVALIDEIIFDFDTSKDVSKIQESMFKLFYPNEKPSFLKKTFDDFEEWPTSPDKLLKIFQDAGFIVSIHKLDGIVGFLTAWNY